MIKSRLANLHNLKTNSLSFRVISTSLLAILLVSVIAGCQASDLETIAITHVNLIPMTEEIILADQTVLIEGSKITAIGPAGEVTIPRGATVIDGEGAYLMPGLADMHMHTATAWESDWPVMPFSLFLANGVTTVRNLDPLADYLGKPTMEEIEYAVNWRDEIVDGNLPGPTMYLSGISLQGSNDWRPVVFVAGDAEKVVQANADAGFDFLKIFEFFPPAYFSEAMAAADKNDLYVTGHIPLALGLENAAAGGLDEIAHVIPMFIWESSGPYPPALTREKFFQMWQQGFMAQWEGSTPETWYAQQKDTIDRLVDIVVSNDVVVCTTVSGPDTTEHLVTDYDSFIERTDMQYSRRRYLDLIANGEDPTQQAFSQNPGLLEMFNYERDVWLQELKKAGALLVLGTDAGIGMGIVPGFSVHLELQTMVNNGFTPYEAIATGTVNASKVVERMLGVDEFGTIEVGKRADLLLVGGNPFEDVSNAQDIHGVMAAGRWYSIDALDEMIQLDP